jgi:hypothetical protein
VREDHAHGRLLEEVLLEAADGEVLAVEVVEAAGPTFIKPTLKSSVRPVTFAAARINLPPVRVEPMRRLK